MIIRLTTKALPLLLVPGLIIAGPRVSISIDQRVLVSGETKPRISVAATNDVAGYYDVHMGSSVPTERSMNIPTGTPTCNHG